MKNISSVTLIANAWFIIAITSCQKENIPAVHVATTTPVQQYPIRINNVIAGRWIQNERGHYVCTCRDVLSNINTYNHSVTIYLNQDSQETLITPSILIMGGRLWAEALDADIQLDFLPGGRIKPFDFLIIDVVVE